MTHKNVANTRQQYCLLFAQYVPYSDNCLNYIMSSDDLISWWDLFSVSAN